MTNNPGDHIYFTQREPYQPDREIPIWANVTHMEWSGEPIVLDPQDRYGEPFDASRFLREMANDLLGPGVLDRGGDKLTDTEFDTLNAALDAAAVQTAQRRRTTGIVPVAMLPSVDGAPIYFDPMSTFGDINHTLNTTPEEKP